MLAAGNRTPVSALNGALDAGAGALLRAASGVGMLCPVPARWACEGWGEWLLAVAPRHLADNL